MFCSWKSKDFLAFWHPQIKVRHTFATLSRNLLKRLPESNTFPKVPNELCDVLHMVAPAVVATFRVARHYTLGACVLSTSAVIINTRNMNVMQKQTWKFPDFELFSSKLSVGEKAYHFWGEDSRKQSSAISKSELKTDW